MSGSPAWGFDVRLKTSHCKNKFVQKFHTGPPNSTDNLERPWKIDVDARMDYTETGINARSWADWSQDLDSACEWDIEPPGSISHGFLVGLP